jgi:hypothetical protein
MEQALQNQILIATPDYQQAWEMVLSQLRLEMSRADFESWVKPLTPLGYQDGVFTVGAKNPYTRDWVESRLKSRMTRILEGMFNRSLDLRLDVTNGYYQPSGIVSNQAVLPLPEPQAAPAAEEKPRQEPRSRKVMLVRAYGSQRAAVVQPDRTLFLTQYFFFNWLPLVGHSAMTVILAARSMCYWNPMTGELRNTVETEIAELAKRASVSVRTVKDVLKNELVEKYFLRYKARRIMTSNGIRTAGITLQVRMDDPLTPEDQELHQLFEEDPWYSCDFDGLPE